MRIKKIKIGMLLLMIIATLSITSCVEDEDKEMPKADARILPTSINNRFIKDSIHKNSVDPEKIIRPKRPYINEKK